MKILILKNVKTGKHYKVPEDNRYGHTYRLSTESEKVGDKLFFIDREDISKVNECVLVKILDKVKKKKKKSQGLGGINPKGVIFSRFEKFLVNWEVPEYIKPLLIQKEKLSEFHKRPYFKTVVTEVKGKPSKGENLEEIKFPAYCIFKYGDDDKYKAPGHLGELNKGYDECEFKELYELHCIDGQTSGYSRVDENHSLKELMDEWDIKILKGELHLWREVK